MAAAGDRPAADQAARLHAGRHGLATTTLGHLLRFTDGGHRWAKAPLPWQAWGVSFADREHAWLSLGAGGSLARTVDGGRTWSLTPPIPVCRRLSVRVDIGFSSPARGFLLCLGQPGAGTQRKWLFATTDGGQTWTGSQVPTPGTFPSLATSHTGGLALDEIPDGIWLQSEPGAPWRHPVVTDDGPAGISWPAAHTLYVALNEGLVKSTDGGGGWRQILPVKHAEPTGPVSLLDRTTGYGASASGPLGDSQGLLETVDGGRSWVQIARFPLGVVYLRARPAGGRRDDRKAPLVLRHPLGGGHPHQRHRQAAAPDAGAALAPGVADTVSGPRPAPPLARSHPKSR